MSRRGLAPWPAVVVVVLLLAGCKADIGEGSGPVGLRILTDTGSTGPLPILECEFSQLYALAEFNGDGSHEDVVNTRAAWTSDDPAVATVSGGGVIVAHRAGTAVIHAHYHEFAAAIPVTVLPIVEVRLEPEMTHLVPGSTVAFTLEVRSEGSQAWSQHTAGWAILQPEAAASVNGEGQVTALSEPSNATFTLEATVPNCAITAQRELQVSPVSQLVLVYEQPPTQALPLAISTMIRVLAYFQDPTIEPQNLSNQVSITLEDTEEGIATLAEYDEGVVLQGLVDGKSAQLDFRYPPLDIAVLSDRYVFADLDQQTLRVDPPQLTVQYPDVVQLGAFGMFSDGVEREVTRHVAWTVSDGEVATVTSAVGDAGELTVLQDVDQDVQVEAFGTVDDQSTTAETDVHILRTDEQ